MALYCLALTLTLALTLLALLTSLVSAVSFLARIEYDTFEAYSKNASEKYKCDDSERMLSLSNNESVLIVFGMLLRFMCMLLWYAVGQSTQ